MQTDAVQGSSERVVTLPPKRSRVGGAAASVVAAGALGGATGRIGARGAMGGVSLEVGVMVTAPASDGIMANRSISGARTALPSEGAKGSLGGRDGRKIGRAHV